MDSFQATEMALKGLRQIGLYPANVGGLSYGNGFLLPKPQLLGIEEQEVVVEVPGGDTTAFKSVTAKSATFTLRWPLLNLEQLAKIRGSLFTLTGSEGNRVKRLKRRIPDVPPYFKIDGRVAFIGNDWPNGDYHLIAYRAALIGSPRIQHETEQVATYEATFEAIERSDGEWYDMVAYEAGSPLIATVDNTAPTLSSSTPADNATNVALAGTITLIFSEAIQWDPTQFNLQHVVSSTVVNNVTTTKTISSDRTTVSLAYTGLTGSGNFNIAISGGVRDLAGNYIAAPINIQFAGAAS